MSIQQILLGVYLLALPLALAGQTESVAPDGPYLLDTKDGLVAYWAYPELQQWGGLAWQRATETNELPRFPGFDPAVVDPERTFPRRRRLVYTDVEKVVALSDIHGQYDVARRLLLQHGVMDEEGNWTLGEGHLVIVGDVFDRGDEVNAVLWTIFKLQLQAEEAGGKVHFLLGNHETMVMDADVRYVNKRYLETTRLLGTTYHQLYGPKSYLGRWLRSLPLTVKINGDVFVHGGFSEQLVRQYGTLTDINDRYHERLLDRDVALAVSVSPSLKLLHGKQGPLWYRGYFLNRDLTKRDVDGIRQKLGARRFIVGHTSFEAIKSYFGGTVLGIDSSIKFGTLGEVLILEDGRTLRGLLDGRVLPVEARESR